MFDSHGENKWTRVATTVATSIAATEARLERIVFGTGRATTDTILILNGAATSTTSGILDRINPRGENLDPGFIDYGVRMDAGIVVLAATNAPFVVIYKNDG